MPSSTDRSDPRALATPLAPQGPELPSGALTVLYDGGCPLCRREIALYRGMKSTQPVCYADVADPGLALPAGAERQALLARFHVKQADGTMASGARAFLALWAVLPGWRWLARLGALPGMATLMEGAYRAFLRLRPAMQRVAARLDRPAAPAPQAAPGAVPADMVGELRSDHAGETGAVMIYRGVLAVTKDASLRDFATRHRATEQRHLALIEGWLPPAGRSRLLGPWRVAGWLTGALPALFGPRAVYATIAAVETFVDHHYQQQIDRLEGRAAQAELRSLLIECQADECHHRDEAAALAGPPPGLWLRAWCALVGAGSSAAVVIARRV
jgi:3-demethoxyubiquinol 3-hydroxylase